MNFISILQQNRQIETEAYQANALLIGEKLWEQMKARKKLNKSSQLCMLQTRELGKQILLLPEFNSAN